MVTEIDEGALARRRLLLRDSIGFVTLVAATAVLFGVTLLLFRSFTSHRDQLAARWADRGAQNMRSGHPEQAIGALRTALNYAPDNRGYEQLLAQALGEAGRTDESYAYFMTLWESQPGSGSINLELARLAAKRGDKTAAVEFYRASIYGTWEGDGVLRRAEVRLELARYLIAVRDFDPARMELLIAAGNSPETARLDLTIAVLLDQSRDPTDAWSYYQKAIALAPRDAAVLEAAGRHAYQSADFVSAHRLLARAEAARAASHEAPDAGLALVRDNAARITQLLPEPALAARDNAARVVAVRKIAKARLDACAAQLTGGSLRANLQGVTARWSATEGTAGVASLRDPALQESAMRLVYDTERTAETLCTPATGDDALLLLAARAATPPASEAQLDTASGKVAAKP